MLAKRKTSLMKDIEVDHKDKAEMRKLRAERRVEKSKQMVTPDASTADYERQLKKLATRGGKHLKMIFYLLCFLVLIFLLVLFLFFILGLS